MQGSISQSENHNLTQYKSKIKNLEPYKQSVSPVIGIIRSVLLEQG